MTSRGPFQPKTFYDSMILSFALFKDSLLVFLLSQTSPNHYDLSEATHYEVTQAISFNTLEKISSSPIDLNISRVSK